LYHGIALNFSLLNSNQYIWKLIKGENLIGNAISKLEIKDEDYILDLGCGIFKFKKSI